MRRSPPGARRSDLTDHRPTVSCVPSEKERNRRDLPQTFRHPEIVRIARQEGRVTVEGLAERLGVTVQTIRRDLGELAREGKLDRVHGGAVPPSSDPAPAIGYEERRGLAAGAKGRIARAVAAEIPPGASLFLDIGTSTEAVARELLAHEGLVVTNNLNVANILAANPHCELVVAGGVLRRTDGGLVGEIAASVLERIKLDHAVIGCSALDEDGDMLEFDLREVLVTRAIMERARQTWLVADATKFDRRAPARLGSLAEIDALFTDADPPEGVARLCRESGTRIVLAPAGA